MREAAELLIAVTDARRVELGKKWMQVYQEAGVTHQTLNRWRHGHPVAPLTERSLERVLLWGPGAREAIAAGEQPVELDALPSHGSPEPSPPSSLSPDEEVFRRMVTAAAKELGLKPEASDEIMRRVRQDLEQEQPPQAPANDLGATPERIVRLVPQYLQQELLPVGAVVGSSRGIPYRVTGRTDLSDLVREARLRVGLSPEEVSERVVDSQSGERTVAAEWLDRLERVALVPDEYPEYAQLDPLAATLGLDVMEVRDANAAQFFGIVTVWSDDRQSKTTLQLEHATPEGIARAKAQMARLSIDTTQVHRGRK